MRIVISPNNPGDPTGLKYKFLLWVQNTLPNLFMLSALISLILLIVGLLMDVNYSSAQTDYTWFQRFGAVVVGWSIFIGMLQQFTFNASNSLKDANFPDDLKSEIQSFIKKRREQAFWLWIMEAFSLLSGTLVWAFGDMMTNRFLHCGQWMCGS